MAEEMAAGGTPPVKGRGRPRDAARHAAVLEAAGDLMIEGGLAAATMEAIAARAGVSKQTIYNWWPSRGAVALEGFMVRADPMREIPEDATVHEAMRMLAVALVRLFATTPAGPLMRSLIADAQSQPEIAEALRTRWLEPRRDAVRRLLDRGIARGELRPGLDTEVVIDHALGSIYYRLLMGHAPLTEAAALRSVDQIMEGIEQRE